MAIRSDMVEAAGLKVEDFKDTTWSEFMELAKKVMAANDVPMLTCSGGSEIVIEMLQSAGASPMVDGKVTSYRVATETDISKMSLATLTKGTSKIKNITYQTAMLLIEWYDKNHEKYGITID